MPPKGRVSLFSTHYSAPVLTYSDILAQDAPPDVCRGRGYPNLTPARLWRDAWWRLTRKKHAVAQLLQPRDASTRFLSV